MTDGELDELRAHFEQSLQQTRRDIFELCVTICIDLAAMELGAEHCVIAIRAAQRGIERRIAENASRIPTSSLVN